MRYTNLSMSNKTKAIRTDQRGIVSLMVTLIMIFVISLLVIAFAQLTRRNQREALDRQQSSQAYYAAETGVNDAVTYLNANRDTPVNTLNCPDFNILQSKPATVPIGGGASYACLKVNNSPTELVKSPLLQDDSMVWPIKASGNIKKLTVTWTAPTGINSPVCSLNPSTSTLPKNTNWPCSYGMMRFDLYNADAAGGINTANMAVNTRSFYIFPKNSGTGNVFDSTRANVGVASCVSNVCTANVKLPSSSSSNYYMRMSMLYRDAGKITIVAKNAAGSALGLSGAQAVIDSTGRAQDQLRRIQVRVSLVGPSNVSGFATQADICKRLTVATIVYDQGTCTNNN